LLSPTHLYRHLTTGDLMTEFFAKHEHEIFPIPSASAINKGIEAYIRGNGCLREVLAMFFNRLRYSYTRKDSKYTPMQVLMDEELLELLWKRVDSKPRLFTEGRGAVRSFFVAVQVGWAKCRSCANFPVREASKIFEKYCPRRGLIYDPSAGFGSRMSAALLDGYGYIATDPNKELYQALYDYYNALLESEYVRKDQEFEIYCQGSEVFIPELEGKVDFAFTSPPYFNLEKYSDDNSASTRNYNNFALWGKEYVIPTIKNIRAYLKPSAKVCINIKNFPGLKLYDCWAQVFRKVGGFKELEPHRITIARRQYDVRKGADLTEKLKNYWRYASEELCMVFEKEG